MKITNIFDAVRDGSYKDFMDFYSGDANLVSENLRLSLLGLSVVNNKNPDEKLKIVHFLISEVADVNFTNVKENRNALHIFYLNVLRPDPDYMLNITKLLVENGININGKDKYNAIPLKYAITIVKLPTQSIKPVYQYLIAQGAKYNDKDKFGKSCVDYANEYSWRNDVVGIIKEFEDGNK